MTDKPTENDDSPEADDDDKEAWRKRGWIDYSGEDAQDRWWGDGKGGGGDGTGGGAFGGGSAVSAS